MMLRDLSYALRQLRKAPGFTITAVLTLAFGIGATAAIFSIVEGVLLRPLPFPQPNHLAVLSDHLEGTEFGGNGETGVTIPEIAAYRRGTSSFASLGGFAPTSYEFSGAGAPEQINAARMTASMFSVLGVAPTIGRAFTQQEDDGSVQVAVLSYSMWHSRFGADPQIPGRKILLDRKPYEIIGVMPRDFEFPLVPGQLNRSQLWVPLSPTHDELTIGAASWCCGMVGRLKPGVTPAQAQQDAERVAQEIMRNYPAFMTSLHISAIVHPLSEDTVAQARPLIRTLFLAVVVVLFIACANLAGLLLVRVLGRRREVAVRLALGASPAT
ncbi:MAG: ABC transporter permease, partial [Terracidiphilus sp.]